MKNETIYYIVGSLAAVGLGYMAYKKYKGGAALQASLPGPQMSDPILVVDDSIMKGGVVEIPKSVYTKPAHTPPYTQPVVTPLPAPTFYTLPHTQPVVVTPLPAPTRVYTPPYTPPVVRYTSGGSGSEIMEKKAAMKGFGGIERLVL